MFWGRVNDSNAVFKIYKKDLGLIKGVKNRMSCTSLFGDFIVLTHLGHQCVSVICMLHATALNRFPSSSAVHDSLLLLANHRM
jgi:hypothetical protein